MGKSINFKFEDKEYTLEFNRKVIKTLERQGFNIEEIGSKPMTMIPMLFHGAFLMHHSTMSRDNAENMYAKTKKKEDLLEKLFGLYGEPLAALTEDVEDAEGNATWEASW
jgi:hypothetical protein